MAFQIRIGGVKFMAHELREKSRYAVTCDFSTPSRPVLWLTPDVYGPLASAVAIADEHRQKVIHPQGEK